MALTKAQAFYVAARRALDAWFVRFDPAGTGLSATNVQDAIAEVAAAGGGGAAAWGGITGTLTDQTDLGTALAGKQPLDATLTALAGAATAADKLTYWSGVDTASAADFTAAGRALAGAADAAAQRTALGLGTAATQASTAFDAAGAAAAVALAKQDTLVSGTNIKTVNGSSLLGAGNVAIGTGTPVKVFLTSTQANATTTPAVLTGHTFTLTPGQTLGLTGQVICSSGSSTTGMAVGVRVAQAATADANAIGSAKIEVAVANAALATQLFDADAFNVAASGSTFLEVVGAGTTTGNNGCAYQLSVTNLATNVNSTVTIEFRSEDGAATVTAQIGSGCTGSIS